MTGPARDGHRDLLLDGEHAMAPDTATYLHVIPMRTELGTTLEGVTLIPLPWGGAAASAWLGTNHGGAPLLSIASEWPQVWLRTKEQLAKFEREYVFLRRFTPTAHLRPAGTRSATCSPARILPMRRCSRTRGVWGWSPPP